jgi:hypothetical protein
MKQKTPERLEAEYQKRKRQIRADKTLSWEAKERKIKELGERYYRALREAEQAA